MIRTFDVADAVGRRAMEALLHDLLEMALGVDLFLGGGCDGQILYQEGSDEAPCLAQTAIERDRLSDSDARDGE